jgi:hypothetical protein
MHTLQLLYLSTYVTPQCYYHPTNNINQGLGQTNLTWKMVITEALAPKLPNIQWILPHAYVIFRLRKISA